MPAARLILLPAVREHRMLKIRAAALPRKNVLLIKIAEKALLVALKYDIAESTKGATATDAREFLV
jgi:hypothetical protein